MTFRDGVGRLFRIDWQFYAVAAVKAFVGSVVVHRGLTTHDVEVTNVGWALLAASLMDIRQGRMDRKLGRFIPRQDPSRPHTPLVVVVPGVAAP